jgi:hypothetical protein
MKLEKILDQLNSFEKNQFLKVITGIIETPPKKTDEIDKILINSDKDLKKVDNLNIVTVFNLIEDEYTDYIKSRFNEVDSQLDILIDILIRDGNCILSRDWFNKLYDEEIKSLKQKILEFQADAESDNSTIDLSRIRDYLIYKNCVRTAYANDQERNQDMKITWEEQTILHTLSGTLELSQEEIKLINYSVINIEKQDIDKIINDLRNLGVLFYSKNTLKVYIADEIVRVLRKIRGKEVANKYFRRVLNQLKEPQLNSICRKHHIDWKKPIDEKIKSIIQEGINFRSILTEDIFKESTKLSEKKAVISELIEKDLCYPQVRGVTLDEKVQNLINHFEQSDKDDKISISIDGYDKLLVDLDAVIPETKSYVKQEFDLQDEDILNSSYLLDYNIKPKDILDLIPDQKIKDFCEKMSIKVRGNLAINIIEKYKDAENLFIENYNLIAFRDINGLKSNGIIIKEGDMGVKFEDVTKSIFEKLGLPVDDKLRKSLNNAKNKIDIVINLGNNELILVECKTVKDSGFNKFSSVSRQIKAYIEIAQFKGFRVIKSLLIAPEFSEDFEKECREEFELNLSLITAQTLANILIGFKNTRHKQFPYQLLMKDVLISEDWVIKAISK